ncbi:MAG: DUF2344 domain-containing protein [Christensenellaceae bacterium]|nr:DUF2344 domain-containing protein [Christensenellaceae bacterium]
MRMIASFYKHDEVRFVSHLDMQRLFQRAFRRANLPLEYSKGFNPHPLLSFATALSVGYTSDGEYFDVQLSEDMMPDEFASRVNDVLPKGIRIVDAVDAGDFKTSLTPLMRSAAYEVEMNFNRGISLDELNSILATLMSGEINVMKRTKGGIKPVDIRPMLIGIENCGVDGSKAHMLVHGKLTAEGGLPLELLLGTICERLGVTADYRVNRKNIEMDWTVIG